MLMEPSVDAEHFLGRLHRLGLGGWSPAGALDPELGVWRVDGEVANTFPADGIDRFDATADTSFWFRHRNLVILERLQRHGFGNCLVVEVGSGSGVVGAALESAGYTTICVEPHLSGAAASARRSVTAAFCSDLASLELPSGSVPVLGAFDVIEHLPDAAGLLSEMRRVVSPTGVAAFTVPAFGWLWSEMDDWNGHFRRYTRRTLRQELAAAGFDVVDDTYLFASLVAPALVVRVLRERLGPSRSTEQVADATEAGLDPKSPLVSGAAELVHRLERLALSRVRLPFGTSLLAVARPRRLVP